LAAGPGCRSRLRAAALVAAGRSLGRIRRIRRRSRDRAQPGIAAFQPGIAAFQRGIVA
jgi:hypothetical protein